MRQDGIKFEAKLDYIVRSYPKTTSPIKRRKKENEWIPSTSNNKHDIKQKEPDIEGFFCRMQPYEVHSRHNESMELEVTLAIVLEAHMAGKGRGESLRDGM
jgi:hypothetical protein